MERTGVSCMALTTLFMMSGSVSIHADEVSAETPLTTQGRAAPAASLDIAALRNVNVALKTEADDKLTLTVRTKDGYHFMDSPFARGDNSNVTTRRKSDNIAMVYNYNVSVYGDVTDSYTISAKGEAVVLTSLKLILSTGSLKNVVATLERNEEVTPLDSVTLTLNADGKTASESVSYAVIDGEKCAMRSFVDKEAMYTLNIMNVHKDTMIEAYGTAASTGVRGTLDRVKVAGHVNKEIASYSTITLTDTAFHKLAKGNDISPWLYSLPKGVWVIVTNGVTKGDTRMQIKFCGEPTELSNTSADIMIEGQHIINSNNGILKVDPAGSTWLVQTRTRTPVITKGDQTYIIRGSRPLELTRSGELRDLYGIFINDNALNSDYYTLTSGSTVLTPKPEYLNTLEKGSYTARFTYHDESYAGTKFTIDDKKQEAST